MPKKTKSYSAEFKLNAVHRMAQAKTISGLAKELGVRRKFLDEWRHTFWGSFRLSANSLSKTEAEVYHGIALPGRSAFPGKRTRKLTPRVSNLEPIYRTG